MTEENKIDRPISLLFSIAALLILLLIASSFFFPSAYNWGYHAAAFLPLYVGIPVLLVPLLILIPAVRSQILRSAAGGTEYFRRLTSRQRKYLLLIFSLAAGVLFWMAREKFYLLGDGSLIIRIIKSDQAGESIGTIFKHSPIAGLLIQKISQFFSHLGIGFGDPFPVQVMSVLSGVASLFILIKLIRVFAEEIAERSLLYLFVLFSCSVPLFFGHVEVYALLLFGMFLFIWISVKYLRSEINLIYASLAYAALLCTHFAAIVYVPAFIFLIYNNVRKERGKDVAVSLFVFFLSIAAILWVCRYPFTLLVDIISSSKGHMVPLSGRLSLNEVCLVFTPPHLVNMANLFIFTSPFTIIIIASGIIRDRKIFLSSTVNKFVLLFGIGSLFFVIFFNSEIGMSRDWDLYASYLTGIVFLSVVALPAVSRDAAVRIRILAISVCVIGASSVLFIILGCREKDALKRFEIMPEKRLWATSAMLSAYEELAIYFRNRRDPENAVKYYKKYISIDPTNPRLLRGLSYIYNLTGDHENEVIWLEKALLCEPANREVLLDLGVANMDLGRYGQTSLLMEKILAMDPKSPKANYFYGKAVMNTDGDYNKALNHMMRTLSVDSLYADAYLEAGICCRNMDRLAEARMFFEKYIRLFPDSRGTKNVRLMLGEINK